MKSSRVHAMGEPSDRPRSVVSGISNRTDVESGKGRSRMSLTGRIIACCQQSGEKIQMTKMLVLTIIPTVALIVMCIVDVTAVSEKSASSNEIKDMVTLSTEIGKFIHFLQRERGFSSLFVSAENQTRTLIKTILLGSYKSTFDLLDKLSKWPSETKTKFEKYPTKKILRQYIDDHRSVVLTGFGQSAETSMREELNFYNNIVMVFINWLYDAIQFSQQGDDWRMLVAYQLLLISKNDMGIERTLGSIFFMRGHFDDFHDYHWYLREKSMGAGNFEASTLFSPTVAKLFNQKKIEDRDNVTYYIDILRNEISLNKRVTGSLPRSFEWFQLMSGYLDIMFNVQLGLADIILESVNRNLAQHTKSITISALILCVVLIICPLIIISVKALVADIQQFASSLAEQTEKLSKERLRTESLLYQMLPRPVAEQLKLNKTVDAETFEEVTIFFSDIVGFTSISAQCSPMEVVDLLNTLYLCFDTRLELYDVYKVETIGDAYMVASGVPNRNGRLHVAEVATMALDLAHHVTHLEIPHLPDTLLRLRAGIHTGPVVAGVVGSKMPRYCLFGDSVNTASRMESTGQADRIQLSWITQASLQQTPGFSTIKRGLVEVKGKGNMETYWLMQKVGFEESLSCMPNCRKLSAAETRRISQHNA